ncbi:MAG: 16S rRNA (guanine(527)-N(7))-methyltransferase RsmG [Bacteroidetes bacterium]|nr:16S rRNA (guanine(527)-N(7))-methyltransferase RsmG [Bacteroidota bacterium]MBP6314857.1 16S rRNA (guanine(527)-N(7))-methyltransferase RsmG [Chitinophagaceae bacterium]
MEIIQKYFDDFSEPQLKQFVQLQDLYRDWNQKINVISRKDIDALYLKHVLHSLAIAARFGFEDGQRIIDIGTGGGFPGIPLAIFFPEVEFVLADSIKKKLMVVDEVVKALGLQNVKTFWGRAEDYKQKNAFDFAVSRAVAPLGDLWRWARPLIRKAQQGDFANGLICLKGGDLHEEISISDCKPMIWSINDLFEEDVFFEKYILYVKKE